jgi:hypothetical protein
MHRFGIYFHLMSVSLEVSGEQRKGPAMNRPTRMRQETNQFFLFSFFFFFIEKMDRQTDPIGTELCTTGSTKKQAKHPKNNNND